MWLLHYGPYAIFTFLVLGIVLLPIPEETLLVLSGVLMNHGKLHFLSTIVAAFIGSMCGITISYLIGRLASDFFINKVGRWVGITKKHIDKAYAWYGRYGKWTLMIGYFIPGVRHLSGFSAGMTKLEFQNFALFAYTGACVWVSLFLFIGYFFGNYWLSIYEKIAVGT